MKTKNAFSTLLTVLITAVVTVILIGLVVFLIATIWINAGVFDNSSKAGLPMDKEIVANKMIDMQEAERQAIDRQVYDNIQNRVISLKTYLNEEFRFGFQYPQNWIIRDRNTADNDFLISNPVIVLLETPDTEELIIHKNLNPGYRYNLKISYWKNVNELAKSTGSNIEYADLEEYLNSEESYHRKLNPITIDSEKAFQVMIVNGHSANYGVLVEKKGEKEGHIEGIYELSFERMGDRSSMTAVENEILGTFKFVDNLR